MSWRTSIGIVATAGVVLLAVAIPASAASAADPAPAGTIGSFPAWHATKTTTGPSSYTGSADFDAVAGFPGVTFSTDATGVKTPTGESAFLGASTGFGMHFGSSRAQPYLYLTAKNGGPSTTTVTFDGAPPAGWGFAVGDIDADYVQVVPRDANGDPLDASHLNAQDTGGTPILNYCNNSPKPSSCEGHGPYTDFPTWWPTGTTVRGTPVSGPLVLGSGADTFGAYDWFLPDSSVRSLTFTFTVQSGIPIFQLWIAALASAGTITGTVATPDAAPVPDGVAVDLEHSDGTPVRDILDNPVVEPIPPSGAISLDTADGSYDVAFDVPKGFDPIPTQHITVGPGGAALDPIVLAATPVKPALAVTGTDASGPLVLGMLALGFGVVLTTRRRRRRA